MATFTRSDDLQGAEFVDVDLRGARFAEADLSGVVMRGVHVEGADIDAPWLFDGESFLRVNGVDVVPFVEAELNRRFPGRADRRAEDPDGLRAAWATLERTWAATLERVAAMPAGTADVSVGGEWSFAQTLRHLVLATDMWLGRAILGIEQPFHPIGHPTPSTETDGNDMSIFTTATPSYAEVLEVRAGRVAMVRDFLATVTSDVLAAPRKNPWAPEYPETILSCLHVILTRSGSTTATPYATSTRSTRRLVTDYYRDLAGDYEWLFDDGALTDGVAVTRPVVAGLAAAARSRERRAGRRQRHRGGRGGAGPPGLYRRAGGRRERGDGRGRGGAVPAGRAGRTGTAVPVGGPARHHRGAVRRCAVHR